MTDSCASEARVKSRREERKERKTGHEEQRRHRATHGLKCTTVNAATNGGNQEIENGSETGFHCCPGEHSAQ